MNMHLKLLNNHSVHPPLSTGVGVVEPPTKFSKKRGGLIRPQLLEGDCWERGGCNFHKKTNQNLDYLTTKKVYEQKYFSLP